MRYLYLSFSLIFSLPVFAGLFRAQSETLNSFRRNEQFRVESPTYEFVSTSYVTEKRDVEINCDFSLFTDPTSNSNNRASLYIFDARFEAVPDRLSVRVGRSFDMINTIGASSVDMVSAELSLFSRQLKLGGFVGVERALEAFDSDLKSNVSGVRADFHTDEALPLFVGTKFMNRTNPSNGNSTENLVEVTGRKPIASAWGPELMIDSVSDANTSNLNRFEVGVDVYPTIMTFSKFRFMTYDVPARSGIEQPIFSIFSTGRLYEGRFQLERKLNSSLIASVSTFYDEYQLLPTERTHGTGAEVEARFAADPGLNFNTVLYYFDSYGGKVVGVRMGGQKALSKANEYYGLLDVTHYEKITSSKREAYTCEVGWSRILGHAFKLTVGGQASSNNILKDDFRTLARLNYLYWGER